MSDKVDTADPADLRHRVAAIAALVVLVLVLGVTLVTIVDEPLRVAVQGALLVLLVAGAWLALTRSGTSRRAASVLACWPRWSRCSPAS